MNDGNFKDSSQTIGIQLHRDYSFKGKTAAGFRWTRLSDTGDTRQKFRVRLPESAALKKKKKKNLTRAHKKEENKIILENQSAPLFCLFHHRTPRLRERN
jgi:hypothetical protein